VKQVAHSSESSMPHKTRSDACFRPASAAILPIWKRIVLEPSIVLNR
jgi:hypothetical protein